MRPSRGNQRSRWDRAIQRALAALVAMAQLLALAAPLADAPERNSGRSFATILTEWTPAQGSISDNHPHTAHHDPATCPACIAQSLVALLSGSPGAVPDLTTAPAIAAPFLARAPHAAAVALHHPRGPPLIG